MGRGHQARDHHHERRRPRGAGPRGARRGAAAGTACSAGTRSRSAAGDVADPWTLLAAIAARTERVTLGAMVFAPGPAPAVDAGQAGDHARSPVERAAGAARGPRDDRRRRLRAGRRAGGGEGACPAPGRDARDPRRPPARQAVRVRGRALPVRQDDRPAAARPAATDPGLGRGIVAERAVDAPGRPLGRDRAPGRRGGRRAQQQPGGPRRGRGLDPARARRGRAPGDRTTWSRAGSPDRRRPGGRRDDRGGGGRRGHVVDRGRLGGRPVADLRAAGPRARSPRG